MYFCVNHARRVSRYFLAVLLFFLLNLYVLTLWTTLEVPNPIQREITDQILDVDENKEYQEAPISFFLPKTTNQILDVDENKETQEVPILIPKTTNLTTPEVRECVFPVARLQDERTLKIGAPRVITNHGTGPEFSTLKNGLLTITCDAEARYGTGTVDNWVVYTQPVKILTEWVWASCGDRFNTHVQVIVEDDFLKSLKVDLSGNGSDHINVLLLMQDSVSRQMIERRYKDLFALFQRLKQSNGPFRVFDFKSYHALGSNSLPNKGPIFGNFCWEKSCTHKWKKTEESIKDLFLASGALWDNSEPNHAEALKQDWVWNHFRQHGYVTMYGEEESGEGRTGKTFGAHSILSFFREIPKEMINFLFPSSILHEGNILTRRSYCGQNTCPSKIHAATNSFTCVGNRLITNLVMDYLKQFLENFRKNSFLAGFMLNFAHESDPEALDCADYYISDFFSWFTENPDFQNTVVFLVADHGQKMGPFFSTPTGITENLLPHLFMLVPTTLLQKYPLLGDALELNQGKLCSPHDLHLTLKHLAVYPQDPPDSHLSYAQSLLRPLPIRDCFSCGIPNNWCLCHRWLPAPPEISWTTLSEFIIQKLNEYVQFGEATCQALKLQEVSQVDMTEKDSTVLPTYRVELSVVAPRQMVFRAFVTQTETGELWMDQWDIAQITRWGPYVKCKPEKVRPPIEAQFCLCK